MAKQAILKQAQGTTFIAKANSNHWVVIDNGPGDGGSGAGTSPKELLLLALAGCTASDVVPILRKKRTPLKDFEIRVTANEREEFPRVFADIHLEYVFYGDGIKRKDVEHAIELSVTKYCSVHAMVSPGVSITHSHRIEPASSIGNPA
jgi:putative redox protein